MKWLKRIAGKIAVRASKYAGIPLRDPALVAMLGNQPVSAGVDVDEDSALNHAAVWQAVNILSSNVAAMPLVLHEERDGGPQVAFGHWAHNLLLDPASETTAFTFYETLTTHALTWGNGFAKLERESGPESPVVDLTPLMPDQTHPDRDPDDGRIIYRFTHKYPGEEDAIYEADEVLHIRGLGFDGLRGYSVIQRARESIGLGLAEEKFGAALFGRGCTPGGLLEVPEQLRMTEKARKNLRESFELLHRGPDNAHRIAILEQGIVYKPLSIPPEDAQFLQSRTFNIAEIARWFNIPPHLLRDLTHATFSNIEHQGIDFLVYSLRPWLIRWSQECQRKLFVGRDRRRYVPIHDPHNLLMTDVTTRYNAYRTGREGGFLTLNDILRKEGKPLLPGAVGDSRIVPLNMRAVDADGNDVLIGTSSEKDRASAQAKAITDLLAQVAAGTIPVESAEPLLQIAAPDIDPGQIKAILKPFVGRPPVQQDPGPAPGQRDWNEGDHPRNPDGKFGSGGGSSGGGAGGGKSTGQHIAANVPKTENELHDKATERAAKWTDRAKELPGKVISKARDKIANYYGKLESRYGRKWAMGVIAAGVVGIPIPLPGSVFMTAAPVLAAAELYKRITGRDAEGLDMEDLKHAASHWWDNLLDSWQDDLDSMPAEDKEVKKDAS